MWGPRSRQSLSWNRNCLAWHCCSEMRDLQPFTCLFKVVHFQAVCLAELGSHAHGCTGDRTGRSDPLGADVMCGLH